MHDFKSSFTKRMAEKKLAHLSIGAFLIHMMKDYVDYPQSLRGYVRWHILFLHVDEREDRAGLFMQKQTLLTMINKRLKDFGYEYVVRDLRL